VSLTHVPSGQDFKIRVPKGVYKVFTGPPKATSPEVDCSGEEVAIRPGRQTDVTLDTGCGIP
jgi:hypothetical protein